MINTYIVKVFEDDVERVFLCSMVMLSPDGLYLVSQDGSEHRFPAGDLIGIESVRSHAEVADLWDGR